MRQFFVTAVAAAALAWAPPVAAQETSEPQVTLDEAITLALRNSPVIAQRQGAIRTAESAERTAFGAYLPSLSASAGGSLSSTERFNPQTNTTVSGSSDSYSAGLSASMDLFTAGRRGAQSRQARAATSEAEALFVEQQFAVTLQAKQAFFAVLRADEVIRVSEQRIERARQGLTAAEERLRVGSATRSDSLRSQLELTQARQALLQAQTDREAAAFALGALIGTDGPVGARLERDLEPTPLALTREELIDLVMDQSPSVLSAEAAVEANSAALRVARTQYFPSLRASAGYDWFNQDAAFTGGRTSWSTRVSLSYNLFNGFSREEANERAEVNLNVARLQVEDARRQVRTELERALGALELAEQQVVLSREALSMAAEDLRVQEARYSLGASTILDQITSQVAVAEAELALINARYDYQVARAQLEALVGRAL